MTATTVTVVLTVYERTQFLREALDSALNQSFTDFEIRIADDSNSPAIHDIVAEYQDPRIFYAPNSSRLGVAGSLRSNMSQARGKYLAVLNDDDIWEVDFFNTLVAELEQSPERILAFSDHTVIDETGAFLAQETSALQKQSGRDQLANGEVANLAKLVLVYNAVPLAMAAVFRLSAFPVEALYDQVEGAYDYWISMLLATQQKTAVYVAKPLARYRIHTHMETRRKSADKLDKMVFIYRTAIEQNLFPHYKDLLHKEHHEWCWRAAVMHARFNERSAARRLMKESFRTGMSLKGVAAALYCLAPQSLGNILTKVKP